MSQVTHGLSLFAGPPDVLGRITAILPAARAVWLTPGADIAALPLTEEVHDALHRVNGTGDWLEQGPRVSSSDMAFARRLSEQGPIAYLEIDYGGDGFQQSAMLWMGGELSLGPITMTDEQGRTRAAHLWPVNQALRALGIRAHGGLDEFTAFGLGAFRSNEAILAGARPLRR